MVLLLLAMGCSTSRITTYWSKQDAAPKSYHKVMVLGIIRDSDRSLRQEMENHMTADLRDLGYNAVSSLQEFGPKVFDQMDEQTALAKLRNRGIDAVITIVLLNRHKERNYVPAKVYYPPTTVRGRFWDYRMNTGRIYEPGYYVVSTRYFWESNLYEIEDQNLICSVQTESFNPSSTQGLAHEYGQLIIQKMLEGRILERSILKSNSL
jgi:hypothetical protein